MREIYMGEGIKVTFLRNSVLERKPVFSAVWESRKKIHWENFQIKERMAGRFATERSGRFATDLSITNLTFILGKTKLNACYLTQKRD